MNWKSPPKKEQFLITIRLNLIGLVVIYLLLQASCVLPYILRRLSCPVVF